MAIENSEREILKQAIEIIERETAENGSKLTLRGFGTFERKKVAAKTGRNPQTGADLTIPARSVFRFSASKQTRKDL